MVSTLRQIIRSLDLQSKKLNKNYGLTGPQLIVLREIERYPQKPISEIARQVSLSQATVTSILDRMEQQGFAKRVRIDKDRRKINIEITEKAKEVLGQNPALIHENFEDRFKELEEWEKSMMIASLQRLASLTNHTLPTKPNE